MKCELGVNGLNNEEFQTHKCSEVPMTLTVQNGMYHSEGSSLDLIVILMMKNADSKDQRNLLRRKVVLNSIEYIFSGLNENDRLGIIKLGDKKGERNKVFLQKLSALSKSMKKLIIQFLSFEEFSKENTDIFDGLEAALKEFNQRLYRNNHTSIVILTDFAFEKTEDMEIQQLQWKITRFERILSDFSFDKDNCFNVNCLYCGVDPIEAFFYENICSFNGNFSFFAICRKLSTFKVNYYLFKPYY